MQENVSAKGIVQVCCLCYKGFYRLSIVTTQTLQALSNQKPQESPKIST
jgi:hypothetical protein